MDKVVSRTDAESNELCATNPWGDDSMEPVISLPYSEYETIVQIQRHFKKHDGFSVCVPVSRQQKGIDFVVVNTTNNKVLRFQVKGSRPFMHTSSKELKDGAFKYTFWFNNFHDRFKVGMADVYVLFGLYPVYDTKQNISSRTAFWQSLVLAFSDDEMNRFLDSIRTKNGQKHDHFFYISFNDISEIIVTRGRKDRPNISQHLLANRVPELLKQLRR